MDAELPLTWQSLALRYVRTRRNITAGTRMDYRYVLLDFAAAMAEVEFTVTADELIDAIDDQWLARRQWAPSTVCTNLGIVRPFLDWVARRGFLVGGVASELHNPRRPAPLPRALNQYQIEALLAHVPDRRGRVIVLLEWQCGLRRAEVTKIDMVDIDGDGGTIRVHGKGGKERVVYPSAETVDAIRAWLIERGAGPGPLICALHGPHRRLTPTWVGMLVASWMVDAGLKTNPGDGVSGHALRHTCATQMLRDGTNIKVVQTALGHESLQTTARYLRADDPEVRAAMTRLTHHTRRLAVVRNAGEA